MVYYIDMQCNNILENIEPMVLFMIIIIGVKYKCNISILPVQAQARWIADTIRLRTLIK